MADASLTDLAAFDQAEQEETLFRLHFAVSRLTLERIQCALSLALSIRYPFYGISITGSKCLVRAMDDLHATKKSFSFLISAEPENTKSQGENHKTSPAMRSYTGLPHQILTQFSANKKRLTLFRSFCKYFLPYFKLLDDTNTT